MTIDAPTAEAETLSGLIAAIYDAAIDPSAWSDVLGSARDFVGGLSAAIFAKSLSGAAAGIYHDDGVMDPLYKRLYFEKYGRIDPSNAVHLFAELEQPVCTADVMDYQEFRQSRFYLEWGAPQGLADFLSAPIEKRGDWAAMFGVFRHHRHGPVDDGARQRMRLLVPHVRRAVLIGRVIEEGSLQAASFSATLDGLASGLFFVDGGGRIVHENAAGSEMLAEAVAVNSSTGRLVTTDRAATAALADIFAAAETGDTAVGTKGISVPIEARDGTHFVAHVLPLTSGARRGTGRHYAAAAAVFVHRATLHTPPAPEVIAKTFGLTLSELRVLLTVAQAGGVAETAATLGVGEATVKTHLHRVFAKTGTARQADLVRLIAGFASPLTR
ncbi:MAG TPA: helix-turn-helix transcriptional regulator [Devosiaceae bacterium]|nr:helix-turn-helix transcriptional regulator [Devosiaceae bacterium]